MNNIQGGLRANDMSNIVWPYLPPDELKKAEEETLVFKHLALHSQATADLFQKRELKWLLNSLQDTFTSLKDGLEECSALLAPVEPGSTLVVSSLHSESVKGIITRVGTRIVKAVC